MDQLISNPLITWAVLVIVFGVLGMTLLTLLGMCDSLDEKKPEQESTGSVED